MANWNLYPLYVALTPSKPRTPSLPSDREKYATVVVITKDNYSAKDSSIRPTGWAELRLKRVMLKEHIDRIAGVDEEMIADMRNDREIREEVLG